MRPSCLRDMSVERAVENGSASVRYAFPESKPGALKVLADMAGLSGGVRAGATGVELGRLAYAPSRV